ncbi:MAG: GntR family transcriptional regulator [Myxococcota bacterium]|nr:GntR family transcriptional regulator [Myxococcota bacterium]
MSSQPEPKALRPVARQSLSDAVFAQLRDQIVAGHMAPGEALPSERVLCDELGVARGAVREALRRLEQARLISVRHGGASRVLDFRRSAGMDLLVDLALSGEAGLAPQVVRGIIEMRSGLAPDVARLAALRGDGEAAARLREIVAEMRDASVPLSRLQVLSQEFWTVLVEASGNLAYQLAFNTLREVYSRAFELLRPILADELRATADYAALADAVEHGRESDAAAHARALVLRGELGINRALEDLS